MKFKNLFKNKTIFILSIIFIISSVTNIIYASLSQRGLTFDGIIFFMTKLNYLSCNSFEIMYPMRFRHCIVFLNNLPITLCYFLFNIHSKYILSVLYTLPLFLFPALFPLLHYILAKRSKRYDIVIWSLFIFGLLIIPTEVWPIVESMLAISIIFLLYHYICADIHYNWFDRILIIILILISFSSSEANIYLGPLLFFISLYYAHKTNNKRNKNIKLRIGFLCALMPISYLLYFFLIPASDYKHNTVRYFYELFVHKDFTTWYKEPYLLLILILISLLIFIFCRKIKIKNYVIIVFSIITTVLLYLRLKFNWFYYINILEYRVLLSIIPALIITLIFALDFFHKKINIKYLHNILLNFLMVTLFLGSFNNTTQIMYSHSFKNTVNEILNLTENIAKKDKKILVTPLEEEQIYNNKYYNDFICLYDVDYYTLFIPAFSKDYKIKAILYPGDNAKNIYPKDKRFDFYVNSNRSIYIGYNSFQIKNIFWDLSEVSKIAKKNK